MGDLERAEMFLEFVPSLDPNGRADTEERRLRKLHAEVAAAPNGSRQAKREHQIREYVEFWGDVIPQAMKRSFGTLGYGTFDEVIADIRRSEQDARN